VTWRTVLVVLAVLRFLGVFFDTSPRLTEPPPIPEITQPATTGQR
jgi:hypothetical protein